MDMRAVKVGQKVTLSGALPGGGITGVVIEATKGHFTAKVDAQIAGEDGSYAINFDYDGNLVLFYSWVGASTPGWDWAGSPCPIPSVRVINFV